MLLYKNGRIYEIERRLGESRHQFLLRCWFTVNTASTKEEAMAWFAKNYKGCSYGKLDLILDEKTKNFTK